MLKGKKVVIFDMDGTLIDSVGIWNEVDSLLVKELNFGKPCENVNVQDRRDFYLRKFAKSDNPYMEYCAALKEIYSSPLTADEIHTLRYKIANDYLENVIDYKEGADTFIKKLKSAGYMLVIASTTKRSNMEIYRTKNKNIINKANIDDYFDLVYTREDATEIKPHPQIYLKVLDTLNVSADECIVFEDSLIGIEAAKSAGLTVCCVYDKYSDGDKDKINNLVDYTIDSYSGELL